MAHQEYVGNEDLYIPCKTMFMNGLKCIEEYWSVEKKWSAVFRILSEFPKIGLNLYYWDK